MTLLGVLGGLLLIPGSAAVKAEVLKEYTGYTRPGSPSDRVVGSKLIYAALEEDGKNGIGGTVYFMVLSLDRGHVGDPWATGLTDLNKTFQPGIDLQGLSSPGLDTSARYLYLYQVVNDRKTLTPIQSQSIRLLVHPAEITSWGHFPNLGFSIPGKNGVMTPVSAVIQGVADTNEGKMYQEMAPAIKEPLAYGLRAIRPSKPAAAKEKKEEVDRDPAREPDHVMLMVNWDVEEEFVAGPRHAFTFVASWNPDNVLKPTERSPIFGYTSNLPPTHTKTGKKGPVMKGGGIRPAAAELAYPVSTNGDPKGPIHFVAADGGSGMRSAIGTVPTPTPQGAGGSGPGVLGSLGGNGPGGGAGAGFPGAAVGAAGTPGLTTATPGGGIAGTSGGSTQPATQSLTQNQTQQQSDGGDGGQVVPEPPAALLALLGLPVLVLLLRRKTLPGGAGA
jgi:hypothetical protein